MKMHTAIVFATMVVASVLSPSDASAGCPISTCRKWTVHYAVRARVDGPRDARKTYSVCACLETTAKIKANGRCETEHKKFGNDACKFSDIADVGTCGADKCGPGT